MRKIERKDQKYRKWSVEEKLRIVKRRIEESISVKKLDNPAIEALNGWINEELYLVFGLSYTDDLAGTLERFVFYFNHGRLASALAYKNPV